MPKSYLLLETGDRLLLESGDGCLLLEESTPDWSTKTIVVTSSNITIEYQEQKQAEP